MVAIRRLNHAVLFVRDVNRSVEFYQQAFSFTLVGTEADGRMAFMRAANSDNHHDLGLFAVGEDAPSPPRGSTGLYHLAWQVDDIRELQAAIEQLGPLGALVGASDHGATKSIYGKDPDGNEFEIMFIIPRGQWGEYESRGVIEPLDLEAEVKRWAN